MSGPPHQFPTGFPNPGQGGMRTQFGPGQMSGPIGTGMQSSPMSGHMQMGNNQMANTGMNNGIGGPMPNSMQGPVMSPQMHAPMGGQPYGMGAPGMPNQHAQLQMQQQLQQLQQAQLHQQQTQQVVQQQQQVSQQVVQQQQVASQQVVQQQQVVSQQQVVTQQQQPGSQTSTVSGNASTATSATPTPPVPTPQASQNKEFNTVSLCRFGQETVQDIVSRTQEVFGALKMIQPPNGTIPGSNNSTEKKAKMQEQLRTIRLLFKRLRLIYEKCNESCQLQGMEYTHIESLIPYKDEIDLKTDEKKTSEAYRAVVEEHKELNEQVVLKNRQLKEVIDHLRRIIWEINTMLNMRRS